MGIKGDSKDFDGFLKGKEFVVKEYLRMGFGFFGSRGKEGNGGFVRSNGKAKGVGPGLDLSKVGI